jgi:hypothetical protein
MNRKQKARVSDLKELFEQLFSKTKKATKAFKEANTMKNGPVTSPVKYSSVSTSVQADATRGIEFLDDDRCYGEDECQPKHQPITEEEKGRELDQNLSKVKFADQIKIDFIPSIDYRILCRFLGVTTVNDIKNHPYQSHPLITLILMESINGFMKKEGYEMVGELNFDNHGNSIPPEKNPWSVKGKETTFTITGFLFFEKIGGDKTDNVSFFLYSDLERGGASITSYSTDTNKSKEIINNLQAYSKKSNCLRGAKLKDVNMITASFSEVDFSADDSRPEYLWDNYYYSKEIKDLFKLEVFDFIENVEKYNECGIHKRGIILHGKPGTGKCLAKGTPVLMCDGRSVKVEDIRVGDEVMGPDSKSRIVLSLANGEEMMYEIIPNKGKSYTVNESHILSLKASGGLSKYNKGDIINISVKDYLNQTNSFKNRTMGYKVGVTWDKIDTPIDPYFIGIWLGDGHSDSVRITTADNEIVNFLNKMADDSDNLTLKKGQKCGKAHTYSLSTQRGGCADRSKIYKNLKSLNLLNNKHIPDIYKINDRETRLKLLAGLIDSDGFLSHTTGFAYVSKSERLVNDVVFLSRSLGFASYKHKRLKSCTNGIDKSKKVYWECSIFGEVADIPTLLKRKKTVLRKSNKDPLVTGIKVKQKSVGEYFGFELSRDGLFLLDDFTVTHNTTIGNIICNMVPDNTVIWITPEILQENNYKAMSSIKALYKLADFLSPCIIMLEDLDLFSQDRDRGGDVLSLGALMNILDGVNSIANSVTIGTTNRLESIEGALRNRPGRFDRIIEIPPLPKDLRIKMFKERLQGWSIGKGVLNYVGDNTEDWTGAEVQEFINSLNLKYIGGKRKTKRLDQKWAEEILTTLSNFGVTENSDFGFRSQSTD